MEKAMKKKRRTYHRGSHYPLVSAGWDGSSAKRRRRRRRRSLSRTFHDEGNFPIKSKTQQFNKNVAQVAPTFRACLPRSSTVDGRPPSTAPPPLRVGRRDLRHLFDGSLTRVISPLGQDTRVRQSITESFFTLKKLMCRVRGPSTSPTHHQSTPAQRPLKSMSVSKSLRKSGWVGGVCKKTNQ